MPVRTSLLLPALLPLVLTASLHANPLKVKTAQGKVQGTSVAEGKVRAFKGIPYAAPPTGNLRWQPPQPPQHFNGTFVASDYGHRCVQTNAFEDMVFHDPGPSEDCLTLNIWAPASGKKLPVMVWIYGGGYSAGATSEARQDGQFLAQRNAIVVTLNYRLGIFGFFTHPQLTAESPHHASGNYGLLDQAAALAWVKQNIRNFGGDPNNITLFGESAGSFSVSAQMASPLSKSLFSKAIGESGAALSTGSSPNDALATREQDNASFARAAYGTDDLAALRKLSSDEILAGVNSRTVTTHAHLGPVIDGYFFPQPVAEIYAAGNQAHIPLMAGWNADEGRASVLHPRPTAASFAADAEKAYGTDAPGFLKVYPAESDEQAFLTASDLAGDRFIAFSTWRWLEAQTQTGQAPVFRYRLDLKPSGSKYHPAETGAFHSDDIEYVFGTLDSRPGATVRPEDRVLSDQMQQYWVNFARTGNPNGPGLPQWPTYKPTDFDVMHLDDPAAASPDANRLRYLFLESHPLKPRP